MTFEQFRDHYNSEEVCAQKLFTLRWPEGFRCPRCEHRQFYRVRTRRLPLFECRSCRKQTSLIAGTILEGSRTPLRLWFQALFLHARPQGISALRLSAILGTTYKTAWLICHKIRHAMSKAESSSLLTGIVRVNCGVYGRPYNPTIYRHPQEHPVLIGATIDNDGQISRIRIKQISDEHLSYDRITPMGSHDFVQRHVASSVTDVHVVIQKFSRLRYWPLIQLCKRASNWLNYSFNGIGAKHLQSYLDQFCFGFNLQKDNANSLEVLFQYCASTRTLNYPTLISRDDRSAHHKRNYFASLKNAS